MENIMFHYIRQMKTKNISLNAKNNNTQYLQILNLAILESQLKFHDDKMVWQILMPHMNFE